VPNEEQRRRKQRTSARGSQPIEACPGRRIGFEVFQKFPAGIVSAKSAARELPIDRALSDFAFRATREHSLRLRTASIAVGDILRMQVHAVVCRADAGNVASHGLLLQRVGFQGCEMNPAAAAVQPAICYHGIHLVLGLQLTGEFYLFPFFLFSATLNLTICMMSPFGSGSSIDAKCFRPLFTGTFLLSGMPADNGPRPDRSMVRR